MYNISLIRIVIMNPLLYNEYILIKKCLKYLSEKKVEGLNCHFYQEESQIYILRSNLVTGFQMWHI
jgi:hypothetical protein